MSMHTLRKRFTRDQNLPIQLVQSPYFEYYLDLYEPLFNSRTKYNQFLKEVELVGGEEVYLSTYNNVKQTLLSHVQGKPSFQRFNQDALASFHVKRTLPKANLYQADHDGQLFVSIDLQKANFHTLRYYDATILDEHNTYKAWLEMFTPLTSLHDSKYFRQVIFGNLNPKKQQKIQQFITHSFVETLEEMVAKETIMSASHDEIVLRKPHDISLDTLKETLEARYDGAFPLHVDSFLLEKLTEIPEFGFVKKYENTDKVEFKGVPSHFMAQAYQHFRNQPVQPEDLLFFHEGQIAQFITPILQQKAE